MFFTMFFSCGKPSQKQSHEDLKNAYQSEFKKKESERISKRKLLDEQENADKIRLDRHLQDALNIANQNFDKNIFLKKYSIVNDDSEVIVEINMGHHFTQWVPHLIIRITDPSTMEMYIDVFYKGTSHFEKAISHRQWNLTYENDEIKDVNGDGLDDFVVNWYGASGCCLKAFSNVYLIRNNQKTFSKNFEFINPTFSPKEKLIRGVEYGHPGQTEMYKFQWVGEKIDTIEYIAFETKKEDSSIKTGKIQILNSKFKTVKVLDEIPSEYHEIFGFDWFLGNP
jgi:hypothetical protein